MSTKALEQFARDAEDKGCEVYIRWNDNHNVIHSIEVDGVEIENEAYPEELEDLYWAEDAYRVAEASW